LVRGPCEVCGTTLNVHAHHDDYDAPLNVRWLCGKHHSRFHAKPRLPVFHPEREIIAAREVAPIELASLDANFLRMGKYGIIGRYIPWELRGEPKR
jgi:ribosomal protein S27AE